MRIKFTSSLLPIMSLMSALAYGNPEPVSSRVEPAINGQVGLLDVSSAYLGREGKLRFSVIGEYFWNANFPVEGASNRRSAGTFAVSWVPKSYLQFFLSYAASANTNSRTSPQLLQTLGDVTLGATLAPRLAAGLYGGVEARGQSFSGFSNFDTSRSAFGFEPRLLLSYNFAEVSPAAFRVHLNAGYLLDNTRFLAGSRTLNSEEQFALNINQYPRVHFSAGVEYRHAAVVPFVEYHALTPVRVPGHQFIAPDGEVLSVSQVAPQWITAGLRVTAIDNLALTAACRFGLVSNVGLGLPAVPPYNFYLGASYNVDLVPQVETRVVEKTVERRVEVPAVVTPAPTLTVHKGTLQGVVLDSKTRKPLGGVVITDAEGTVPPVATDAVEGKFISHPLMLGPIKLAVRKEGYSEKILDIQVTGKNEIIEVTLDPVPARAYFTVDVVSEKKPVPALLILQGPTSREVNFDPANEKSSARIEALPGKYQVKVTAPGYLAQTREVQVSQGVEMALDFDLEVEPQRKLVVIKANKITILQQVHFATGQSIILPDSYNLLNQVIDTIVRNDIKRVKIEGHTDNKGGKDANLSLSEYRAQAVADYFVKNGIERARIEVLGYGGGHPIAPNISPHGRELNRRVEFIILDK